MMDAILDTPSDKARLTAGAGASASSRTRLCAGTDESRHCVAVQDGH